MSTLTTLIPPPTEINDTHKVYSIAIVLGVLCGVTTVIGLLRLYVRWSTRSLGLDDYAFIPALIFYIGWTVMGIYVNLNAGVGKPLWEITLGEFSLWFKGGIAAAWLYPPMSMLIRVSILLFYQRIFSVPNSTFRRIIQVFLAIQPLYLMVFAILPGFVCKPFYKAWDPLVRNEYFNNWYYYYTQVGLYSVSMAFDAILLVMPVIPIWELNMPIRKRLEIVSVFMMGAAASIAAAYKLGIFVAEMQRYTHIDPRWLQYEMSLLIPPQFDTYGTTFWIPSQVEPTVALIGASLPALRKQLSTIVPQMTKLWTSMMSSSPSKGQRDSHGNAVDTTKLHSQESSTKNGFGMVHTQIVPAQSEASDGPYIRLQEWDHEH